MSRKLQSQEFMFTYQMCLLRAVFPVINPQTCSETLCQHEGRLCPILIHLEQRLTLNLFLEIQLVHKDLTVFFF